jgi:excinuclease ABC subunit B
MQRAIEETNRRREKQVAYNTKHDITPQTIKKAVRDLIMAASVAEEKSDYSAQNATARLRADPATLSLHQIEEVIAQLEKEMKEAARALNFEYAAELRDEVNALRKFAPKSEVGKDTGTSSLGKDAAIYGKKSGRGKGK